MSIVLLVDDESPIQHAFQRAFRTADMTNRTASTAAEAIEAIRREPPDAILLDVHLPDASGLETYERIRQIDARVPVIMITGHGTTDLAIEAMKAGAFDFLLKPLELNDVRDAIDKAVRSNLFMRRPATMPEVEPIPVDGDLLVGRCPAMQDVYKAIGRVAATDTTVLILGESGTGKELVARAIYQHSLRVNRPFVAINCGAIPESLIESELFGHEKGAFTGADRKRIGKFEQAAGGTIFLDEVAEMSPQLQAKLLRVTQGGHFQRVGSSAEVRTNARMLAASNRDLEEEVKKGRFREDLFYRLNVVELNIPPLRERPEDILSLAAQFINEFTQGRARFSSSVPDCLRRYGWPGNVRELRNAMERAALLSRGELILPEHLPSRISALARQSAVAEPEDEQRLAGIERQAVCQALRKHNFNRTETAKALGISRRALLYKVQRLRELGYEVDPA